MNELLAKRVAQVPDLLRRPHRVHEHDVLIAVQPQLILDAIADPCTLGIDVELLAGLDQLGTLVLGARIDEKRVGRNPISAESPDQFASKGGFADRNGAGDRDNVPHKTSSPVLVDGTNPYQILRLTDR
jgi:hypothetical protein